MKLAIVVSEGIRSLDVAGPLEVFAEANNVLAPHQRYAVSLVGVTPGPVRCSIGMELPVAVHYADYEEQPDLLLVVGGPRLPEARPDDQFLAWLGAKASAAARFGSVSTGAFLLGRAGLLDGREVTTHCSDATRLAEQFPMAVVRSDRIFVRDRRLFTSAGVAAGIDLCLALVAEDWGHEMAWRIARKLVVCIRGESGQPRYTPCLAVGPQEDTIVDDVLQYVSDHIGDALSIDQLAGALGVSRRTFSRRFSRRTDVPPSVFVEQVRVDFARKLLAQTDVPMKTVAFHCGFHSAAHMRLTFARRLDITPMRYRLHCRGEDESSHAEPGRRSRQRGAKEATAARLIAAAAPAVVSSPREQPSWRATDRARAAFA